jgi:type IV pilus assembly protein PilN
MIRINLLPIKEAQLALGRRQQRSVAILSVAVALLVMIVPYLLQGRRMSQLDGEIQQLSADVAKFDQQVREVRDLDKKRAELQAKLKVIDDLKQKRVGPVRVLEDLGSATPEKLWLVNFGDSGGAATITGMALDNQTIAEFMRQLQTSKYFFEVDLVETSQSEVIRGLLGGDTGVMFKKFIVKARLDYLGRAGKAQPAEATTAPARAKTGA